MITFDHSPTVYWMIGYLLAGMIVLSAGYKKLSSGAFVLLGILLLFLMRMPVIVFNRELNPDESQMLSHAITLFQDPVYWRSVDGTTIGPLDNYLLVVPRLFGFEINYTSGRFMGLLCSAGSLLLLFFSLKNWFGENTARLAWVVPLFLLSFTQEVDFVHYSSEQLPVFLLALCIWLLSRISVQNGSLKTNAFLLGLVAGAVPFAKLQAVPQAFVLVFAALFYVYQWFRNQRDVLPLIWLLLGGITFPLITLIWTLTNGVFTDMIDFYLLGNAIYAGGQGVFGIPGQFSRIFSLSPDFQFYTFALILPILLGVATIINAKKRENSFVISLIILLLLLAGIYAVTKSGNDFIHYLNFCILPWTLLAAAGIQRIAKFAIIFPAAFLLWFAGNDAAGFFKERKVNNFYSVDATTLAQSPVVEELKKYCSEADYMIVWGWQCRYYVEAQLAQGTAENHSERSIFEHPMREVYRKRYMSDLERTNPAFILDAVGKNSFWVQDKKTQGIESYPALLIYVQNNYKYIGDFDGTRLFVRNDRAVLR